jgi:hypothetical protein
MSGGLVSLVDCPRPEKCKEPERGVEVVFTESLRRRNNPESVATVTVAMTFHQVSDCHGHGRAGSGVAVTSAVNDSK